MPHYKNGFQNLPLLSSQSCLSSKFSNFNFEWTSHQAFSWLMSFWLCSLILGFWWKHLASKNNSFIFSTRTFAARGLLPSKLNPKVWGRTDSIEAQKDCSPLRACRFVALLGLIRLPMSDSFSGCEPGVLIRVLLFWEKKRLIVMDYIQ